ncbi:hypothetical protein ACFL17_06910 [Pseudomonadota bacterium]
MHKRWGYAAAILAIVVGLGLILAIYFVNGPYSEINENAIFKGVPHGSPKHSPDLTIKQVLKEANDNFTYRGKPIHPGWLSAFDPGWGKERSLPSSVDVSAILDSNLYSGDVQKRKDWDGVDLKWYDVNLKEGGSVGYKRIMSLFGVVHVLRVYYNGGGSQSLGGLMFVTFKIRKSRSGSEPFDQLMLHRM